MSEKNSNTSDNMNLDNLQIWTQAEMLSAFFAGLVVGFSIGLIF